jgi:hypothetical protein
MAMHLAVPALLARQLLKIRQYLVEAAGVERFFPQDKLLTINHF